MLSGDSGRPPIHSCELVLAQGCADEELAFVDILQVTGSRCPYSYEKDESSQHWTRKADNAYSAEKPANSEIFNNHFLSLRKHCLGERGRSNAVGARDSLLTARWSDESRHVLNMVCHGLG